jgi:hypothetical protein
MKCELRHGRAGFRAGPHHVEFGAEGVVRGVCLWSIRAERSRAKDGLRTEGVLRAKARRCGGQRGKMKIL